MSKGMLISKDDVDFIGLMEDYIDNSKKDIFLVDGFPRN
jgi:hypothetical protein